MLHTIPLASVRSALTECACWLAIGACLKGGRVARSLPVGFQSGFVCNTRTLSHE